MGSYYDSELERQKKSEITVNTVLPILAALETIATAKATRGQAVGTSTLGLIKDAHSRRADALERAQRSDKDAFDKNLQIGEGARASKRFAMDEAKEKRESSLFDMAIQDKGETENRRLAAIDRMLGVPNQYDEGTNTVTMGAKGLPDLSPLDREKIRLDPAKFAFEKQAVDPLSLFISKWDHQIANPKPVAPGSAGKSVEQIEAEAAAKARGAASVVKPMTADDQQTIKMKLNSLKVAKDQIENVKKAYKAYSEGMLSGKWMGMLPTEAAENFETASAALKPTIQALVKVPGMGSMSDFESRLAMAPFPEPGKYNKTNEQAIAALEQLVNQTEQGYMGLSTPETPAVAEGTEKINKQGVKVRMTGGKWQPVQ